MNIAIIGTGNIGGTLALKWAKKGHQINIGVRDLNNFKGKHLLKEKQIQIYSITEAVQKSEVILMATPAMAAKEVSISLGDTNG
jgi:8-hydroxy-5-deazaflavin:NADPH oxidoreductase